MASGRVQDSRCSCWVHHEVPGLGLKDIGSARHDEPGTPQKPQGCMGIRSSGSQVHVGIMK